MRDVVYRQRATYDIESIVTYISTVLKNPKAAEVWLDELNVALKKISDRPDAGIPFETHPSNTALYRVIKIGDYKLFYSFNEKAITVWRIVHVSHNLADYALIDIN